MSSKELFEQTERLLILNWDESEKLLIKRLTDSLISYKLLLPKSLKQDIKDMLVMSTKIKEEYDNLIKYNNTLILQNEIFTKQFEVVESINEIMPAVQSLLEENQALVNGDLLS